MGGLKQFFEDNNPAGLTAKTLEQEIRRLEKEAEKIEHHKWDSQPHLDAANLLRHDAAALKTVLSRVLAGRTPLSDFEKGERYQNGALVLDRGAIWQKTAQSSPFAVPGHGDGWQVIAGTPAPKAAPAPATVDMSFDLTKGMADGEEKAFLLRVEKRAKGMAEAVGFSAEQLKRPASLRYHLLEIASVEEAVTGAIKERDAKIASLTKRLDALEAGGIKYLGNYQRACAYPKGAVVTHSGSMWVALTDTPEGVAPGKSQEHWQLSQKG